jgi:hypothetical protein
MLRASERRIKTNARERREPAEYEEKKGELQRGQCPLIARPTLKNQWGTLKFIWVATQRKSKERKRGGRRYQTALKAGYHISE